MYTNPGAVIIEMAGSKLNTKPKKLQFSKQLGIEVNVLDGIINGKEPITPEIAKRLSIVLGGDSNFWLNLYSQHIKAINQSKTK